MATGPRIGLPSIVRDRGRPGWNGASNGAEPDAKTADDPSQTGQTAPEREEGA
jgi:hypothetical protein